MDAWVGNGTVCCSLIAHLGLIKNSKFKDFPITGHSPFYSSSRFFFVHNKKVSKCAFYSCFICFHNSTQFQLILLLLSLDSRSIVLQKETIFLLRLMMSWNTLNLNKCHRLTMEYEFVLTMNAQRNALRYRWWYPCISGFEREEENKWKIEMNWIHLVTWMVFSTEIMSNKLRFENGMCLWLIKSIFFRWNIKNDSEFVELK